MPRTELAKVYRAQRRYDEAIDTLEDLLKLEPQSLFARTELSKVFRAQKRYNDAEIVLVECLKALTSRLKCAHRVGENLSSAAKVR